MTRVKCRIMVDYKQSYKQNLIVGYVELQLKQKMRVQRVTIEITGVSKAKWTLQKPMYKFPRFYRKGTALSGKQMFYYSRHTLIGEESLSAPPVIISGKQLYCFKCGLPENLPPTCKGTYGSIIYSGHVTIVDSSLSSTTYVQKLVIYTRRNLALETHLLAEQKQDVTRKFFLGAISIGSVEISVWLPLCGIAAGQSLPLLCTINNKCKLIFGGIVFVLTQIEIFRSSRPVATSKTVRRDICRVARMADILPGKTVYYCALKTNRKTRPTNQFWRCRAYQLVYEVWVALQGAFPRYSAYNYPNIHTPGIPVIIGTKPLVEWDADGLAGEILKRLLSSHPPVEMEPIPPDEEVEQLLTQVDEELDEVTIKNLMRQLDEKPPDDFEATDRNL